MGGEVAFGRETLAAGEVACSDAGGDVVRDLDVHELQRVRLERWHDYVDHYRGSVTSYTLSKLLSSQELTLCRYGDLAALVASETRNALPHCGMTRTAPVPTSQPSPGMRAALQAALVSASSMTA